LIELIGFEEKNTKDDTGYDSMYIYQ